MYTGSITQPIFNEWYGAEDNARYWFDNNYTLWLEHITYNNSDYYNITYEDNDGDCIFYETFLTNGMTHKEARIKAIEILKQRTQEKINHYMNMMNQLNGVKED